jgi:lipopolysaccharide export system permease protein
MGTIDRYVLRLYIKVLLICFASLTGLFIVIDALNNLDDLLNLGKQHGSLATVFAEYYGARSLAFFDRTSALMVLVAATFAVTTMQRSNELCALMAAGIPKARVVAPLLAGAVVVALLAAASREWVLPEFRDKLTRDAGAQLAGDLEELTPRYDRLTDIRLAGKHALRSEQRIIEPAFRLPLHLSGFGVQLTAREACYHDADGDRPAGYLLQGVTQPAQLAKIDSLIVDGQAVILSPRDTPWLQEDQCFVVSAVSFEDLAANRLWQSFSSTAELISRLRNPSLDFAADVRVMVHARIVQPMLDIALLMLGLPVVLSRESRNVFFSAGLCVLLVAVFFLVVLICHGLGNSYLVRPSLAAWCPLLIFAPLAGFTSQNLWQ